MPSNKTKVLTSAKALTKLDTLVDNYSMARNYYFNMDNRPDLKKQIAQAKKEYDAACAALTKHLVG